jgi:hypothetical protein
MSRQIRREIVDGRVDDGRWLAKTFEHDVELARRWVKTSDQNTKLIVKHVQK